MFFRETHAVLFFVCCTFKVTELWTFTLQAHSDAGSTLSANHSDVMRVIKVMLGNPPLTWPITIRYNIHSESRSESNDLLLNSIRWYETQTPFSFTEMLESLSQTEGLAKSCGGPWNVKCVCLCVFHAQRIKTLSSPDRKKKGKNV